MKKNRLSIVNANHRVNHPPWNWQQLLCSTPEHTLGSRRPLATSINNRLSRAQLERSRNAICFVVTREHTSFDAIPTVARCDAMRVALSASCEESRVGMLTTRPMVIHIMTGDFIGRLPTEIQLVLRAAAAAGRFNGIQIIPRFRTDRPVA